MRLPRKCKLCGTWWIPEKTEDSLFCSKECWKIYSEYTLQSAWGCEPIVSGVYFNESAYK